MEMEELVLLIYTAIWALAIIIAAIRSYRELKWSTGGHNARRS
jgi:hypothetical protein